MFHPKFSSKDSAEAAGVVGKVSPTRSLSHCESVSLRVLLLFTGARRHGSIMWQLAELSKQFRCDVHVEDYDLLNGIGSDLPDDVNLASSLDTTGFRGVCCIS